MFIFLFYLPSRVVFYKGLVRCSVVSKIRGPMHRKGILSKLVYVS